MKLQALAISTLALFTFSNAERPGYTIQKIVDSQGDGAVAMTVEVPKNWQMHDSIRWDLGLRMNPMSYSIMSVAPDQKMWVSYLSSLTYDFAKGPYGQPLGKMPPARATDFLLEEFRGVHPHAHDIQIVDRRDNEYPFPGASGAGVVAHAYKALLTVHFVGDNGPMDESLTADIMGYSQPMVGGGFHGNWLVNGLSIACAPQGHLPEAQAIRDNMLTSARMSTHFLNRYKQVAQMLMAQTRAENQAALNQRAQVIIRGDDGVRHGRAIDKDLFIAQEELKGLRAKQFSRWIGN